MAATDIIGRSPGFVNLCCVQASEPDGFLWQLPGVAAAPVPGLRVHAPPAPAHHQGRGVPHHDRHRGAQRHCFQVNLHLRCSASTWYPMFFSVRF